MKTNPHNFEGAEKKLEVILCSPQDDLRSNEDMRWNRVAAAASSTILSKVSTPHMDAYLLSESSLFVWNSRILMITCGQSTLTAALSEIIGIVDKHRIAFVFYERKNLMYPQQQPSDFEDEAARIQQYFPGKSYRLGPANLDHVHVFFSSHTDIQPGRDATLQLLMHDIDPSLSKFFFEKIPAPADQARTLFRLKRLYPQAVTDHYRFSPYGYSLNGIFETNYFTIHVTPQPEGSYASFETNIIETDYSPVIQEIISFFKPGKFSTVLTTSMDRQHRSRFSTLPGHLPQYHATEKSLHEFDCGFAVTFLNYAGSSAESL